MDFVCILVPPDSVNAAGSCPSSSWGWPIIVMILWFEGIMCLKLALSFRIAATIALMASHNENT
jgi:hypothetical protein